VLQRLLIRLAVDQLAGVRDVLIFLVRELLALEVLV